MIFHERTPRDSSRFQVFQSLGIIGYFGLNESYFWPKAMLSWTEQKPSKPGWYWMLNPSEEPGLPTIVQINSDWESGRSLVLIPASSTEASGRVLDLRELDALWAGPIELPVVLEKAA